MRFVNRLFLVFAAMTAFAVSSCVESNDLSFEEVEKLALDAWMEINKPEVKENNYQERGGFYVEVLEEGVQDSVAVRDAEGNPWVWFDVTCRDLKGNVVLTRDYGQALQQDSYTTHTHYVPYFLYCGADENTSMPEGTYMALRNKLKIGKNLEFKVRYGTKLRLYLPSSVAAGDQTMGGDGGYGGQYVLDAHRPMIVDMQVWGHVANPLAYEDSWLKSFAEANGGVAPKKDKEQEKKEAALRRSYMRNSRADEGEDKEEEVVYDDKWHLAVDSIAGLYVNYLYTPKQSLNYDCLRSDTLLYAGQTEYKKGEVFEAGLAEINRRVDEALLERFGEGVHPADAEPLDSTNIAKVWYVARLLDGFIVDTNIPEVKRIVYDDVEDDEEGKALDFYTDKDSDANKYVDAWIYAVPQLKLGAWNLILTTSSNAYGATGVSGTSSSSSSSNYADYYNYYNYYNSYYGNGYYNNYYNNYYGYGGYGGYPSYGGYGGYYGNYYNNYYNSYYYNNLYNNSYYTDTTTTTTVTTEIQPYSPLLWQVYIEEDDK